MVCVHCRTRPAQHEKCKGAGWCDCQHRVSATIQADPAIVTNTMQHAAPSQAIPFALTLANEGVRADDSSEDSG